MTTAGAALDVLTGARGILAGFDPAGHDGLLELTPGWYGCAVGLQLPTEGALNESVEEGKGLLKCIVSVATYPKKPVEGLPELFLHLQRWYRE